MKLVFASDHAGYRLRRHLADYAMGQGHSVVEVGATSDAAYDYPDAADEGVRAMHEQGADFGVFVCGSGIGICIRANRYDGIRGAPVTTVEAAKLAREHNDANVLCLGERTTDPVLAEQILTVFLAEPASQEERHKRRVQKLDGNANG